MIYFPSLYSDDHLNTLAGDEPYQKALRAFGAGWAKAWDARSLIYRYQATRDHDVGQPFGGIPEGEGLCSRRCALFNGLLSNSHI